jgi:hypothetical protein
VLGNLHKHQLEQVTNYIVWVAQSRFKSQACRPSSGEFGWHLCSMCACCRSTSQLLQIQQFLALCWLAVCRCDSA